VTRSLVTRGLVTRGLVTRGLVTRGLVTAAPALAVLVLVEALLLATGTDVRDTVRYGAYLGWGVLLPGTLVHRALRGRPVRLSEDLAAGFVVGLGLELAVFVTLVWAGWQVLLPWWPLAVVVPMLAVPRLRRCWRWGGAPGWTPAQAWALAGVTAAVVLWLAQDQWLRNTVDPALAWLPSGDVPFHLALAGELRNHIPAMFPWVYGESLDYHWFHHAHLAAASEISGVELRIVLMRLAVVPLVAAAVLLTATVAARLSGRGWAGPAAAGLAFVVGDLSPYLWTPSVFREGGPLGFMLWYGSSQTHAAAVLALTVVLLVDLLRDGARHAGRWVLLALTVAVLAGTKAPFLPVLGGGLGLAFAVQLLLRRRLNRTLLVAGLLVFVMSLAAVVVLFQGQPQGLTLRPFGILETTPSFLPLLDGNPHPSLLLFLALTALAVTSWCARWIGAGPVLWRRWDDPVVGLLAGCMVAGLAGTLLTYHAGLGPLYFLRAALPLGAVLAAWGLTLAFERAPRPAVLAASAVAVGVVVTVAVAVLVPAGRAQPAGVTGRAYLAQLALPLLLAVAACAVGAALLVLLRHGPQRRRAVVAAALVAVSAAGLLRLGIDGADGARYAAAHGLSSAWTGDDRRLVVTPWNLAAARWLRDHSSPDDVVATNVHCRRTIAGRCDNRLFWVAGFAERRVLVEGWGFTSRSNADYLVQGEDQVIFVPYWDPAKLAANDAAFADPSPERLALLRDRWGVRWLFVQKRGGGPQSPHLGRYADLRYSNRDAAVYELRGVPAGTPRRSDAP
jgi:hypothetical protein